MKSSILATALLFILLISSMPGISTNAHAMSGSADKASLESIARSYL